MAFFLKLDLALNICRAAGYSGVINGFRGPEQFFGSRKFDHVGCLDATRVQSRRRGLDRSSPTERNSDKATSTGAFGFLLLFSCSFHFSFFFCFFILHTFRLISAPGVVFGSHNPAGRFSTSKWIPALSPSPRFSIRFFIPQKEQRSFTKFPM